MLGLNSVKACDWPGKAELSEWNCTAFIPAESADRLNGLKFAAPQTLLLQSGLRSDSVAVTGDSSCLSEVSLSILDRLSAAIKNSAGVQSGHIYGFCHMELPLQPRRISEGWIGDLSTLIVFEVWIKVWNCVWSSRTSAVLVSFVSEQAIYSTNERENNV